MSVMAVAAADIVKVQGGQLEGAPSAEPGVRVFKAVPYAAPPVGDLRWRPPRPAPAWSGVRKSDTFGNRCVQTNPFPDMFWRDPGESEDCLYLAVWTPAKTAKQKLPVMVWIHGGGFFSGAHDEPRQDGARLAARGVVVVNINYRLGVLGFYAHPELTKESPRAASGNYGLLDQVAALQWVNKNIAAFGGDPRNVTIFGESAGSFSVSALVASPLTKGLIHKAIGQSGAFFTVASSGARTLAAVPLGAAEESGLKFAKSLGAQSLAEMRSKPPSELIKALGPNPMRFAPIIDGYMLPSDPYDTYTQGKQNRVPLLAGWNRDEVAGQVRMSKVKPTAESLTKTLKAQYGDKLDEALKVYPAGNDAEALASAELLASDNFIAYCTWKWIEVHEKTSGAPVYRYRFDQVAPAAEGGPPPEVRGAAHATDIEYVFNMLDSKKASWRDEDRKVADLMGAYWTNFAKKGDPNGPGLPAWPKFEPGSRRQVMYLDANAQASPEKDRPRYEFLDQHAEQLRARK